MKTPLEECLELLQSLVTVRQEPVGQWLRDMRRKHSMLHEDVLLLIYHLSKTLSGEVLEIGPYLGGSTIAAALGTRNGGHHRTIVTVEPGGRHKHPRLPSKDILRDLKKNLAKQGVSDLVRVVEGYSGNPETVAAVRSFFAPASIGLCIIDADGEVQRDLQFYQKLFLPDCWLVVDDYCSASAGGKATTVQPQVDALVAQGELVSLGLYGWGTWIGRWRGAGTSPGSSG